jgi:type IV pilus assembly protein PilA
MKNLQKGFTLIELMIVVAIIAILAAIAIPAYQNYIARSALTTAVAETASLKTAVEDCLAQGVEVAAATCPNAQLTSNLGTVVVTEDSIVETLDGNAPTAVKDATVTWTREDGDNGIEWTCATSAEDKYKPSSCKG